MSSSLFVQDDEEDVSMDVSNGNGVNTGLTPKNIDQIDDPVIREIPINLIQRGTLLQVLQYPGRANTREFRESKSTSIVSARQKSSVDLIEVETPLNPTKFFDELKSEHWGNLRTQQLGGVFVPNDGYFAGSVRNGEINLIPVNKTAQMRPVFDYIDKETQEKKEVTNLNPQSNHFNGNVQVVQMTVKSSVDNVPRLGGALLTRKKADEEAYTDIEWKDIDAQETREIRKQAFKLEKKSDLVSQISEQDYFDALFKETTVEHS